MKNRLTLSGDNQALLNCNTSIFSDNNVNIGDDSNPEHHYWRIEKISTFGSNMDPSNPKFVEMEEMMGGTLSADDKIAEAIARVHEKALENEHDYEYGVFVYMDMWNYYHMTLVYTSCKKESIYVEKNYVPEGATIVAFIHTHYKHNDNIIFNELELPDVFDNYVVDVGGCIYRAKAGNKY